MKEIFQTSLFKNVLFNGMYILFNILLQAAETAGLEEQLQGWGEVILVTDKILRWEKTWFPAAMLSVVSLIFL